MNNNQIITAIPYAFCITDANDLCCQILGYTHQELLGMSLCNKELAEETSDATQHLRNIIKRNYYLFHVCAKRKDDQILKLEINAKHYEQNGGQIIAFIRDITNQKKEEYQLKTLLNSIPQKLFYKDKNLNYVYCNESYARDLRIHQNEITGKTDYDFFPMKLARRYIANDKRVIETGESDVFEQVYTTLSGHTSRIEVFLVPIRDEKDDICGVLGVFSDVIARHRVERKLEKSHQRLRNLSIHLETKIEEQRRNIAREIHDELGQALTALKIDLSWLAQSIPKSQETALEKIATMQRLIDTTSQTVRRISSELRPRILDDFGLVAAMEWQVSEFKRRTGIQCQFIADINGTSLNRNLEIMLFRIFQESLTNIARHSGATSVKIIIKERSGVLWLKIRDNGKGITDERIYSPTSFGLMGMRERARYWGGDTKIRNLSSGGTSITVSVPCWQKGAK